MTDVRSSDPARPGEVLDDRYRLEELIGTGGMGTVWRATDDALGRTVAVKVFAPGTAQDSDAVRRESEKRLLASVNHPSLVTLFDAHLASDARSYLVMEYIDGGTLADRITNGAVGLRDAASLAADLGEALHVVHDAGIIHRDIKPANILLRPPITPGHTFRAVLADFGIAYLLDAARVTVPGTTIGTAAYISPEQVRGHAPTPASDIYSLGLVLIEVLSGRRAFGDQTPIEAISVRLSAPPEVSGEWGEGWRSLLTAMTAIDPGERPTALEVSARGRALDSGDPEADVTRVRADIPGSGAGDEPTKRFAAAATGPTAVISDRATAADADLPPRPPRTHAARRWLPIIVAALVIAVLIVGAAIWWTASSAPPEPPALPQLEEPLNTHLQDLLDEVSP